MDFYEGLEATAKAAAPRIRKDLIEGARMLGRGKMEEAAKLGKTRVHFEVEGDLADESLWASVPEFAEASSVLVVEKALHWKQGKEAPSLHLVFHFGAEAVRRFHADKMQAQAASELRRQQFSEDLPQPKEEEEEEEETVSRSSSSICIVQ